MSIDMENLRRVQAEHAQAESERAARADHLLTTAGDKLTERESAISELRATNAEFSDIDKVEIEQRADTLESTISSLSELTTAYEETQKSINELQSVVAEMQAIIGDNQSVAPELAASLEEANKNLEIYGKIAEKQKNEIGELEQHRTSLLEDDQLKNFERLRTQVTDLTAKIADLESDDAVIDLLVGSQETGLEGFAQAENTLRNSVVQEVQAQLGNGYVNPLRREYAKVLTQKFLTEEFKARGIYEITDQRQRIEAMKDLSHNIRIALRDKLITGTRYLDEGRSAYQMSGVALSNIIGMEGSPDRLQFVRLSEDRSISSRDEQAIRQTTRYFILKHLDTINFMLSQAEGYGGMQKEVTKISDVNEFRATLANVGITSSGASEPVMPLERENMNNFQQQTAKDGEPVVDNATVLAIRESYGKNVEMAKQAKSLEREKETRKLAELEKTLEQLERADKTMAEASRTVKSLCDDSTPEQVLSGINSTISQLNSRLETAKSNLAEHSLQRVPIFGRGKHTKHGEGLEGMIADIEKQLEQANTKKSQIEKARDESISVKIDNDSEVKKTEVQSQIEQIRSLIYATTEKLNKLES